ncbi:hypothetical protein V6N13_053890 [Hibiscus sabdariffa]
MQCDNKVAPNFWFSQDSTPNVWEHPNVIQKLRMQSNRGSEKAADKTWPTQNVVSRTQQVHDGQTKKDHEAGDVLDDENGDNDSDDMD